MVDPMATENNSVKNQECSSVLIFGETGAGKSTITNTLLASTISVCDIKGLTKDFQRNKLTLFIPEQNNLIFIDSRGFNDPNTSLEEWISCYNKELSQTKHSLALCLMNILWKDSVDENFSRNLADLVKALNTFQP